MANKQELQSLKIKRATLLSQLEMLSSASPEFYEKLGRVEANIFIMERELLREVKNTINED